MTDHDMRDSDHDDFAVVRAALEWELAKVSPGAQAFAALARIQARLAAARVVCPDCRGAGVWGGTSPRGIGGQTITACSTCEQTGYVEQGKLIRRLAEAESSVETWKEHWRQADELVTRYEKALREIAHNNGNPPVGWHTRVARAALGDGGTG
jgi:hypothetical protein